MSLGRLAETVLQQGLVERCTLTRDSLVLVLEGRTFTYGWAEGQQFLRLLLTGADRENATPATPAPERDGEARPGASAQQGRLREDYLDTMLTFAARAGFIEGFDKDVARGKVTLRTHATTTDLTFAETLEYLTSVVLDELSAVHPAPPSVPYRNGELKISVLASEKG